MNSIEFINKKNIYTILSILIIVAIVVHLSNWYKKKLESSIADKIVNGLISNGSISATDSKDPEMMIKLKGSVISYLDTKGLMQLYRINNMSSSDVNSILSGI